MVLIALVVIAGTASAYFVQSSSAGTVSTASGNEIQVNTINVGGTGTSSSMLVTDESVNSTKSVASSSSRAMKGIKSKLQASIV